MTYARNEVIAGDYKGSYILAVLGDIQITKDSRALEFLDSNSVESYEIVTNNDEMPAFADIDLDSIESNERIHYLALRFKDGKKSVIEVERDICTAIIKNCLAGSIIRCGVTPEKIKFCDPDNKVNCKDCICVNCIVWPKCCYGRMFARRKAYSNLKTI